MRRTKVLLDTGIGDHIDEAFALALAACAPELELIGVTTTSYDAATRAILARRLLGAFGRTDVPVAAGSSTHFRSGDPNAARSEFTQVDLAQHAEPMAQASPLSAVDFLGQMIKAHAPVTIVATAPLTNIAELIHRHKDALGGIERIVFMGGWSSLALPEYNVREDADAVHTVLRSGIPATAVGYEVTLGCAMRKPHVRWLATAQGEGPQFLRQLYQAYRDATHDEYPILHDPLTVATLIDPSLVTVRRTALTVVTQRGPAYGVVLHEPHTGYPVDVCVRVDADRYLDLLLRRVAPEDEAGTIGHGSFSRWSVELLAAHWTSHYPGWRTHTVSIDHTLILAAEGEGTLHIGDAVHVLSGGCVAYLPPDTEYEVRTKQGMDLFWLQFSAFSRDRMGSLVPTPRLPGVPHVHRAQLNTTALLPHAQRIMKHWMAPGPEGALICQAGLCDLLASLFTHLDEEQTARTQDPTTQALHEARRYIEAHFTEDLTLDALGQHVGMSKYHLLRAFKQMYGVTPTQYQIRLRIHHAKRLLRLHYLTVTEVAAKVGYDSVSAFCRAFRREVGVSPGEYRE